ncbi:MAG: serine O-acetyltransferase EpsC [Acholeplasmataceae bacterium]|nr:serine O-acetyltransferase EpsC [Acholeplasmatales bacterium]
MFFKQLRATIRQAKKNDPSAPTKITIFFTYPGIHALMWYRVAHFFYQIKLTFIARIISNLGRFFTNVDIHPGAKIGEGLFIDHGAGVVIGQTAVIGKNVVLFHGVTLGSSSVQSQGKRHPTLEDNVVVYANSTIIGDITIGKNSVVGASSVVKQDIGPNSVVVGNPIRLISVDGKRVYDAKTECEALKDELTTLRVKIQELEERLSK